MSYQLKLDEMLDVMQSSNHPKADECVKLAENLANHIAVLIGSHLGIDHGTGTFEGTAFAGLCVPFHPAYDGQPLPPVLAEHNFDDAEEWAQ